MNNPNATRIPKGRNLTDATIDGLADQVADCLKIWGLSKADAYRLAVTLKYKMQNVSNTDWNSNPLQGTNLIGDKITDAGLIVADDIIAAKNADKH